MSPADRELIKVCREANAVGKRQTAAVMQHFDVDLNRAKTMIAAVKRRNPDHGLPNEPRGPIKGQTTMYDRQLVAKVAWQAFHDKQRLATVLSRRFGMSEAYAKSLLGLMRKEGIAVPFCPFAPHGPHLRKFGCPCDECQGGSVEADRRPINIPTVTVPGTIQLPESAIPMGPWVNDAACRGINTNLFYPERGDPTKHALEVCKTCTVKADCLQYAIDNCERWGVWGGMTERQRRRIRSDRYQARRNIA